MFAFCEFSFGLDMLAFCEFSFGPDICEFSFRPDLLLLQIAEVQTDQGSASAMLHVHFVAWKDALRTAKEERAAGDAAAPAA